MDFEALITSQNSLLNLNKVEYIDELELMKYFFKKNCKISEKLYEQSVNWLHLVECNEMSIKKEIDSLQKMLEFSEKMREQGNIVFQSKDKNVEKGSKLVKSILLYTEAIFAAAEAFCICKRINNLNNIAANENYNTNISIKKCEELLSLGYANRSIVLLKFGYFQETYDDCFFALEIGYPKREKQCHIILRQIICNNELMQMELMEKHLKDLNDSLKNVSVKVRMQLSKDTEKYQQILEEKQKLWIDSQELAMVPDNDRRDFQEICYDSINNYGRYLVTRRSIKANEVIFKERATAIHPVNLNKVCNQCAKTNFIPIPCKDCGGTVVYCSLSCLRQHQDPIHRYECPGYRLQFLQETGLTLIALHMILDDGLLQMLKIPKETERLYLQFNNLDKNCSLNPTDVFWKDIITYSKDLKGLNSYRKNLQMIDHLDKIDSLNRAFFAVMSHLIVVYLINYTDYFQELESLINGTIINWPLIVSAIILRHMAQIQVNGYVVSTLEAESTAKNKWGNILNELIWLKPWHLKRGYLHCYGQIRDAAVLNMPHASLCNHSCKKMFNIKSSGRWITTFATENLDARTEITHCYRFDYKHQKHNNRRQELKELYYFNCLCKVCKKQISSKDVDKEFNKYYQYRCDDQRCGKIFVPNLTNVRWWEESLTPEIFCTKCQQKQKMVWWKTFVELIQTNCADVGFKPFFALFEEVDKVLIGNHDCKAFIVIHLLEYIFLLSTKENKYSHFKSIIEKINYKELLKIIRCNLNYKIDKNGQYTLYYVAAFTYLWDLMALNNNILCDKKEIQPMLDTLKILPDDIRIIFINYYHEYIKDKVR